MEIEKLRDLRKAIDDFCPCSECYEGGFVSVQIAALAIIDAAIAQAEAGEAVCRWTFTPMGRVLRSPHEAGTTGDLFFPFKFCPDCGRRVEVV